MPSSWNCTPKTPTLSDAFADTVVDPDTVALFAGAVSETVGAVVSGVDTDVFMSFWISDGSSARL